MTQVYRTLRLAPSDRGVLGVVIDASPMNLIGPEPVRYLVTPIGALESDQKTKVLVLESADPDYFVPHVDLTKVAEYTAEAANAGGPDDVSLGMLWHKLSELLEGRTPSGGVPHANDNDPTCPLPNCRPAEADLGAPRIVALDVGTAASAWGW